MGGGRQDRLKDIRWAFGRPTGSGPVATHCPLHEDSTPSCQVYPDHAFSFCCGTYFTAEEILAHSTARLDELPSLDETSRAALNESAPPPNPVLVNAWRATLLTPSSPRFHRLAWFKQRGLSLSTVQLHTLGHTGRYFSIPVFSKTGKLLGYRFRRDDEYCDPLSPKYTQPKGQPALLYRPNPGGRHVAITEGEFDALILAQLGVDAMTSTAGAQSLPAMFRGWKFRRRVHVLTDQDEPGEDAYRKLKESLSGDVVRVHWSGANDVSEYLAPLSTTQRLAAITGWFGG